MAGQIVSEPLLAHSGFNWVFLVELLICSILTVFFLFYFNRLFATLVSYGIRAYTWRAYHAYIDIQALQISLLGGRIFFKDIRYHGHNETILVHGGYITWNYWLRRVRDADLFSNDQPPGSEASSTHDSRAGSRSRTLDKAEKGGKQTSKKLPCRISIKISGVEAFMYNRSPAYDSIIEAIERKTNGAASSNGSQEKEGGQRNVHGSARASTDTREDHQNKLKKASVYQDAGVARAETGFSVPPNTKKDPIPSFLRLLPVYIDCNKGAIVVGNEHTLSVITAHFEKANGELNAASSGSLDVYQQIFNFQFHHPVVHMKPNPDFKASQLDSAARFKQEAEQGAIQHETDQNIQTSEKRRRWRLHVPRLPVLSGMFSKSTDSIHTRSNANPSRSNRNNHPQWQFPGQERWKGLSRYLDDNRSDGHGEWDGVEYAKTSLIVDCPCVNVSFYWDVPGLVPSELDNSMHIDPIRPGDINGSAPPEYGMDIEVFGGVINYGPWVDRHRAIFQAMFFPGANVDAIPASPLKAGDLRVLSIFKLYLSIEKETVLRIPIREPSKDWKWKGKARTLAGHDKQATDKTKAKSRSRRKSVRGKQRDTTASSQNVRPFAWIDVKVSGNSSVNYVMDMVASDKGFQNKLDVDIASTEITSSVNHGLLWRSGAIGLDCDLSNPISWNTLRKWAFNISCRDLELFLLRDHLFLLTDLVADWGSGPPSNYFTFVPFQYFLNIDFTDFKLYLNTNDSNIINNPSELDENNFIVLYGQRLHGDVTIPLDKFRPLQNEIKFDVRGIDMGLRVSMSSKNTLNTFVSNTNLAQLGGLVITGSHTYMTETSYMNTDRLFMDISGDRLTVELYGWLIHHFLKLKDNYFGDDMHFKTLEEFQGLPSQSLAADPTAPNGHDAKISNDLDVILCISVEQAGVLLPTNLYSADHSLRADLPFASADLRFTNYYMDLMVNFSPIGLSRGTSVTSPSLVHDTGGQTEVYIESIGIFGHRLFGLPPTEPTYICNWDFDVGKISGECTSEFVELAAGAIRSFAFTLDDDENTLPIADPPVIPDSTFLRLRTHDVHIWLHIAKEVVLVSTGHVKLDFNDRAGGTFSQRLNAWIPNLAIGAVDARSASRHRTRFGERQMVETHAFLQTDLTVNMLNRKLDFTENRNKQQAHIQIHDQRTNRAQFMLNEPPSASFQEQAGTQENFRPPAMQFPEIPHAIFLFQPRSQTSSSSASGYSSDTASGRGRALHTSASRSVSSGSMVDSIRSVRQFQPNAKRTSSSRSRTLLGNSSPRTVSTERYYTQLSEEERARRNLPPSSVALSSSLAAPYFPLDLIEPDMTDVPTFPTLPSRIVDDGGDALIFNDVSSKHFDESFDHTSLLIATEPGIRLYCTPEFVRCISNLVDILQPCQPEDLLDDFQLKVMTKILDHQKRREGKGKSIEFSVRVPFTHVRFQNEFVASAETNTGKDQYDIILNQLKTAARIKSFPGERAGENSLSLHTTLGSLGLSVTERNIQGPSDDVAIQAEMRDVLVWVLKTKETSVNVNFRGFETAAASKKVEYLASLIHRTTLLGEELGTDFADIEQRHKNRLRYLAWHLTSVQEQFQDPAFLTKASYTLRAVRDHLRSHDSWKIISRFRYIWQSLSDDEKARARTLCCQSHVRCPSDAEEKVIAMWDQWRTWDLAHVKKSLAMRMLFGSAMDKTGAPLPAPLHLDLRSAGVKLIIDPGPKQSEAGLSILAINVALIPPSEPTGLMLVGAEIPKQTTIVQVNSRESSVHIHWEICELVENLIAMFQKESLKHSIETSPACPPLERKQLIDSSLQVVYITEKAELSLDTVNLQSNITGRRFRLSVVRADDGASGVGQTTTLHFHLDQTVMQLLSRARLILQSQFDQPSIYFAHHEHGNSDSVPDEIKIAGASRMIKLRVEEDILGLIEVADSVLRDEVAYFHEQTTKLKRSSKGRPSEPSHNDKVTQLPNVTLALLMDEYLIELALLQSLTWSIVGSSGRISVVPALGQNVTLRVDYDLAAHTHRMLSNSVEASNIVSSLELPPLNGRIKVTNTEKSTKVSAAGIIETIELQASEIQALVTTLNKPEMSNVVTAIREDVEIFMGHLEEVFPKAPDKTVVKAPESSRDIVFSVQMTLSGLNIRASAPGQHPDSATANLAVRLSSIQLTATNLGPDQSVLALPEAVVLLHEISVDLTLSDAETIRRCGHVTFGAIFQATANKSVDPVRRVYRLRSSGLEVNIFADTASAVVDVMNYLQDKIKDFDLSKEKKYLRRLRHTKSRASNKREPSVKSDSNTDTESVSSSVLFTSTYSIELLDIYVSWIVGTSVAPFSTTESEDLVLSFRRIDLSTRKEDAARLMMEDMQLQMVPVSADKRVRSANSALLPEVVFNVAYNSTKDTRKIAFHAAGKSLDLQLTSRFILPANVIERSIALAGRKFRIASANWNMTPTTSGAQRKNPFGNKRLSSLLVDASFAGAVVHINGSETTPNPGTKEGRSQQKGRYSQFVGDASKSSLDLRAPGIALKVEYQDDGRDPSLNAELRVDGSSNTLFPTVVPVIIEMSESIKEVVREKDGESPASAKPSESESQAKSAAKLIEEDNLITADPSTILGKTRLNLGLRICKQEFSLSCQPIARVAAIAKLNDIYITVNSVKSQEHGHFFAASAAFEDLEATVQHVYSRESTFGFNVDSVVLSLMNSKHLSGTSGISAILKINPMALQVNARQLQDFLLFREIWVPLEIRKSSKPTTANASQEPQEYLMQRYHQVTAATAFPWNANVAIADVSVELDLGQAIGKTSLNIHNMWASSKKGIDWEQNLCIGVEKIGIESSGRTSGFVELAGVKVRTCISWPPQETGIRQTPLIQASVGFRQLRVKAGFDYQAFVIANIANFDFLMYNVHEQGEGSRDRLVAILDGDKAHVFCTATSASQGLALWQALERLVQENQQAYTQSLKDIEKFLRRKSSVAMPNGRSASQSMVTSKSDDDTLNTPISLHTDVVVTLRSINLGVFPSTFVDTQILMLEAADVQARFAVALERGKIHSGLGMTLGQLSVALSSISSSKKSKSVSDLTVEGVADSARSARGGTILRVPKVIANMHTWQTPRNNHIDYIFKSSLEGKVDVGWNYSRISYIRSMWSTHSRTLASRLGKPLPESNIKITQASPASKPSSSEATKEGQEKITAVVNVPQSKYEYTPLEPPLIETPQLRDMGEATPPLEWIGLHRDRLPNVTHQIVIVTLLEVAREVEDAYGRILGSS
ncbi:hypothetical protein K458DRAFT_431632 [Lentithecium fluviatile CBS 122367]|uniref:Fermentation associated protein n=1 Tax=Lentithecium fluviatile CBS 122367 TaxID=1168545 RepID=A0A6G1J1B9_9PLEO|nr:hypothetical protein K458DRAFT_431632 [Lentithecium fluviatile CBS 122367]